MFNRPSSWWRRLLGWLERLSIQRRLFLSYIIIILIPTFLVSLWIFRELKNSYIEDLVKKGQKGLEIEAISVKLNIETMERSAQLTLSNKEMLYYLDRSSETSTADLIEFKDSVYSAIQQIQFNNPNLEHIRVYMNGNKTPEIWPIFLRESRIQSKPWYEGALRLNRQEMWSFELSDIDPLQENASKKLDAVPKLSLLREIEYPKDQHAGILQVDMPLARFFPNTFQQSGDRQSQMLVMDQEGRLFYNANTAFWQALGLQLEVLTSKLKAQLTKGSGSFQFSDHGASYLAVFQPIERLGVYSLQLTSLEQAFRDINWIRNWILLVNVILFALLSISTYSLTSLILKKLRLLSESMKKVRKGEFHFNIAVYGQDEVGELAHHFRKMLSKINDLIAEGVDKRAASKEAELRTLKNQIDSHFLYNTLENIKMLAEIEQQHGISDALTSLGVMMRYNLRWTSEFTKLGDELDHLHHFVALMNLRFDDQTELDTSALTPYADQELLKMTLQPIVENAMKHGRRTGPGRASLRITALAHVEGDVLILTLTDNGAGIAPQRLDQLNLAIRQRQATHPPGPPPAGETMTGSGHGIGLSNVHQRIEMTYGYGCGLRLESEEGSWTRVIVTVPYRMLKGGAPHA
ncbi:two-component sensor histidine kinase [Paenibacillus sp. CAA11]|uniref:sensor histidine kinase n=1 Tax=Paenibacillus sp. CAA11 TaxID=1532905 RepID=UPI000D33A616|nr:histidine kinase [Paenibacillus sp. CAA11]AWB43197.1 two-component sensor histidine kinase [Paenibacillus sp. CAA11]